MHVKAFGLMTRHPVKLEALPEDLRDAMPVESFLRATANVQRVPGLAVYFTRDAETFAKAVWNSAQALPLSRGHQVAYLRQASTPTTMSAMTDIAPDVT